MEATCEERDDTTVVRVTGEVDLYTSPRMREAILKSLSRRRPNVVVDLSGVSYMDSSGIATLVEALHETRNRKGRLVLAGLNDRVREVFELARLHSVFELAASVEAALAPRPDGA